jgi:hypothetical protein
MRYRAQYSKLSPAVQMIGLQLWLPVMFVVAFVLCYVLAFHHPAPKDMPVAVIGSEQQMGPLAEQLEASSGGAFEVSVVPDLASVEADIRDGDLAGAFTPGSPGSPAQLTVASSAQFQLATAAQQTFTALAAAEETVLQVDDIAPLPASDSYGTVGFYLALVFTIAGYMTAMFIGMMGAALSHRVRLGIIAGVGLALTLLATVLAGPVVGAFEGHFLQVWMLGWSVTLAAGLVVNGLSYFLGRFVAGAALVLFVFLGVPASGGAFPPEFVPSFFAAIHPFVLPTGILDVLRSVLYDSGAGTGRGVLIIGGYAVVGLLLTFVGKPYAERRARRRAERGAPVPMMLAAQGAAMAHRAAEEAKAGSTGGKHSVEAVPVPENEFAEEEAEVDAAAAVTGASAGA